MACMHMAGCIIHERARERARAGGWIGRSGPAFFVVRSDTPASKLICLIWKNNGSLRESASKQRMWDIGREKAQ